MEDELPTFESMFRKSKGLDLAEEAPSEEESTPAEIQRSRVSDKLTDEDGNSRLKHKANVPALENYNPDINAPQGEVHDADKLKATRKSAGIREMIARECFEKTGRIPDVDFMDTYQFQKAPTYVPESDAAKLAFHDELSSKNLDKKEYPKARRAAQTARHYMAREALENQDNLGPEADSSTEHLREISPYPIGDTVIMNTATDDGEIDPSKIGFTRYHNDDLGFRTPKTEYDISGMRAVDAFSRSPEAYGGHQNSREKLKKLDKPDFMESLREYIEANPHASEEELTGFINNFKKRYGTK